MKTIKILSAVISSVFVMNSCVLAQDGIRERVREMQKRRNQNPQSYISDVKNTVQKSFEFEKLKRTFLIHTPTNYDGKKELPLVLAFHGGIGTGKQMEQTTDFSQLADKENFIVVYLDGINNQWNDGRGAAFGGAPAENDVGFVSALIDYLQKNYKIDRKRIYATGASNGGIFLNRLGVELSDKLAAIAPVVGGLPIDKASGKAFAPVFGKTKPLPVLMINGTDDTFVKWDGGTVRGSDGRVTSVPETVSAWTKSNGCKEAAKIENLPDRFADDGTTLRRETYSNCKDKSEVVLYAIVGGGHGWLGSASGGSQMTRNLTGKLSRELNSTETIWAFFKPHSK